jgi:hypothetical protein
MLVLLTCAVLGPPCIAFLLLSLSPSLPLSLPPSFSLSLSPSLPLSLPPSFSFSSPSLPPTFFLLLFLSLFKTHQTFPHHTKNQKQKNEKEGKTKGDKKQRGERKRGRMLKIIKVFVEGKSKLSSHIQFFISFRLFSLSLSLSRARALSFGRFLSKSIKTPPLPPLPATLAVS